MKVPYIFQCHRMFQYIVSFHLKYLIILSNHLIITIGEINRKIRRKNLKNNCLYSILTLCFSLHGFVTIQTTIKHIAPIIAILIHIYFLFHINFSQIQTFYFHHQEYCQDLSCPSLLTHEVVPFLLSNLSLFVLKCSLEFLLDSQNFLYIS